MKKKIFYQIIIYGIANIIPRIINCIFLKTFTKKLNYNQYATYNDMYSISSIIIPLLTLGLDNAYFKYSYKKNNNKIIFSNCILIILIIAIIFLITSLFFKNKITLILNYKNNIEYCVIFIFIIFFDIINILPICWLRKHNMPISFSIIKIINLIIHTLGITYCLNVNNNIIITKNNKTKYIFFTNLLSSFISTLLLIPILIKQTQIKNLKIKIIKKLLIYSVPIMISNLSLAINENLDKFIIKRIFSNYEISGYTACYKIATCMNLYITAFRLGIEPYMFKISNNKYSKYIYKKINYIFIIIGSIIYTIICLNIKIIANIMINKNYHKFLIITPIIVLSNFIYGIYNNISISLKIKNKTIIISIISLIGLSVTILSNIAVFFFKKNIISAIGNLLCYVTMLISCCIWNKYYNKTYCYISKRSILHIIFSITISYLLFNCNNIIINIFIQILYLISVYVIEKKKIKKIFQYNYENKNYK